MNGDLAARKGRRLLVHVVDQLAADGHPRPFALIPKTKEPKDGFKELSYRQLAAAINAAARWLEDELGKACNFEPFAFLGPVADPRYIVLVLAAMKTGHKAYFPSPRNSLAAHLDLLKQISCDWILAPKDSRLPIIDSILKNRPSMKLICMPELDWLVDNDAPHYLFNKTFDEVRLDPCVVLHTSGSTGIPKAVNIKHQYFTITDAMHMAYDHFRDINSFVPYPLFHCAGLINNLSSVVFNNWTAILAPNVPITPELCNEVHIHGKPKLSFLPASTIKDLVFTPEYNETLKTISCVAWGGAPLATEVGVALSKVTYPMNTFGITEAGALPWELIDREDWQYLKFGACLGAEFRQVSEDQYEMVMVKQKEHELAQGVFTTFPHHTEWPTKDLWSKHPTKPDLWMYRGRRDDIIVFSNGEKLNPLSIERWVNSHPDVSAALVIGRGRFQAGMLIEPAKVVHTDEERTAFLQRVWPTVSKINEETVQHGRISQDMIILTSPDKPMLRAGKGSVQRQLTEELYSEEINKLYDQQDDPNLTTNGETKDRASIRHIVDDYVKSQLSDGNIQGDTDIFSLGMDSLQVINLVKAINKSLSGSRLTPAFVYKHPSISKLTAAIASLETGGSAPVSTREERMTALFTKYASDLPITARSSSPPLSQRATVAITGSTGSLGSYLLHVLSTDPKVERVICLNRSEDAPSRQADNLEERSLDANLAKVEFLTVDLSKPYFNLSPTDYRHLLETATHIIHNAWPVNFNLSVESFETQIQGVRRLVDFSAASAHNAHIFFISTWATVRATPTNSLKAGKVSEVLTSGWSAAQPLGYAESKLVSENMLAKAAELSGVNVTVCRVGQVAGPVTTQKGVWNEREWFPSIIRTSESIGVVPERLGSIDEINWMPVDLLAESLAELLFAGTGKSKGIAEGLGRGHAECYNVVNPSTVSWQMLLPTVLEHFEQTSHKSLRVVPYDEWLKTLKGQPEGDVHAAPALKIMPFLQRLLEEDHVAVLDTAKAVAASPKLAAMGPVREEWMAAWLKQWDAERA